MAKVEHLKTGAPGEVLGGRHRLKRVLGQGGIGLVWEALNAASAERVAIKLIRPGVAARDDIRRRLAREARAAVARHRRGCRVRSGRSLGDRRADRDRLAPIPSDQP